MALRLKKRWSSGTSNKRTWLRVLVLVWGAGFSAWVFASGCGARTGLDFEEAIVDAGPDRPEPTGAFCGEKTYDSGQTDLSMYVVLDRSGSMLNDNRWSAVSSALSAFVDDPDSAGLGVGLLYYPITATGDCSQEDYTVPAVPIAKLPASANAMKTSLASVVPAGDTPTLPALRGAIEYARGVTLANVNERVVLALVTDGAPNGCGSTAANVAALEQQAATTEPKILTYVIGLATGYTDEIALMASAGGTGKPILVDKGAAAAQTLVEAMISVKTAQEKCVFGVPIPPESAPTANDVSVRYRLSEGADEIELPIVVDFASCSGEAFFPDNIGAPGTIALCPAACAKVHGSPTSEVIVTAGCGKGTDGGLPDAKPDATICPSVVDFSCVESCASQNTSAPACIDGEWVCPPGTFNNKKCTECPIVPHGCCVGDGTFVVASCVGGAWVCPPGSAFFGTPECSVPAVCAGSLPCPFGAYCDLPDDSCGESNLLGACKSAPSSCPPQGPAVCGCDGVVHQSACEASKGSVDVDSNSPCKTPFGTFECGGYFCIADQQVCRKTTTLGSNVPVAFQCLDIPSGCGIGCNCKLCNQCPGGGPCGLCGPTDDGGVLLQCTDIAN